FSIGTKLLAPTIDVGALLADPAVECSLDYPITAVVTVHVHLVQHFALARHGFGHGYTLNPMLAEASSSVTLASRSSPRMTLASHSRGRSTGPTPARRIHAPKTPRPTCADA